MHWGRNKKIKASTMIIHGSRFFKGNFKGQGEVVNVRLDPRDFLKKVLGDFVGIDNRKLLPLPLEGYYFFL